MGLRSLRVRVKLAIARIAEPRQTTRTIGSPDIDVYLYRKGLPILSIGGFWHCFKGDF
jgi:hypothetical protein